MTTRNPRQKNYDRRQRETRGLVKVCVWVPPKARESLLDLAEKLRKIARASASNTES